MHRCRPTIEVSADFTIRLMHDLTHAYTLVIVVSIVVVALALVPVAFLPNRPPPAGQARNAGAGLLIARYSSKSIVAIRSTVAIGSVAFSSAFTASLSHSMENPCTSDQAANCAPPGSDWAC